MTETKPTSFRLSVEALNDLDDCVAASDRLYARLSADAGMPTPTPASRTHAVEQAILTYREYLDERLEELGLVAPDMDGVEFDEATPNPSEAYEVWKQYDADNWVVMRTSDYALVSFHNSREGAYEALRLATASA